MSKTQAKKKPAARAAKKKKLALVSVVLIDVKESTAIQSVNQPIVHEEDDDGNLVEVRLGSPTYLEIRLLVTPWLSSRLDGATVLGAIKQYLGS